MNENQRVAAIAAAAGALAVAGLFAGIQLWRIKWMAMHVRALEAENKSLRQRLGRERYCLRMLLDGDTLSNQYTAAINLLREARQTWDAMDPEQHATIICDQKYWGEL